MKKLIPRCLPGNKLPGGYSHDEMTARIMNKGEKPALQTTFLSPIWDALLGKSRKEMVEDRKDGDALQDFVSSVSLLYGGAKKGISDAVEHIGSKLFPKTAAAVSRTAGKNIVTKGIAAATKAAVDSYGTNAYLANPANIAGTVVNSTVGNSAAGEATKAVVGGITHPGNFFKGVVKNVAADAGKYVGSLTGNGAATHATRAAAGHFANELLTRVGRTASKIKR